MIPGGITLHQYIDYNWLSGLQEMADDGAIVIGNASDQLCVVVFAGQDLIRFR